MKKSDFRNFVEEQINIAAGRIIDKGTSSDGIALGRLNVFLALRRALDSKATPEDIGILGAFNDACQKLAVLDPNETIFSGLEA
ncbi:hypothetical protein ABH909_003395 [Pseudomonas sp. BS3782 TE3695]|jgi:hypothetical protein|uniref:hypothetical protein n=1 Tax=Pseudomonas sp. BS3782 TE3695 TaxID=3349323 RepID=UPI003D20EF71